MILAYLVGCWKEGTIDPWGSGRMLLVAPTEVCPTHSVLKPSAPIEDSSQTLMRLNAEEV